MQIKTSKGKPDTDKFTTLIPIGVDEAISAIDEDARAGDSPVPEMHWWTFEAVIVEE